MFYVYILRSLADDGLYIGYSADLSKWLAEHNHRTSPATKHRGAWQLIYYEAYIDQQDARGWDRYLKSGAGRRFLRQQLRNYRRRFLLRNRAGRGAATWAEGRLRGYPAWIRTKNNASKGRCVTVTPRGKGTFDSRFSNADRARSTITSVDCK